MLGNFSFGDYFKREAIHWAWEFLTDKKWLGLDPEPADASPSISTTTKRPASGTRRSACRPDRIERMGEDDNFWPASAPSQGPDGVCGPCSEIYLPSATSGKAVEIWNLVFTQFNRVGDPPNNLRPLPSKNIDTGMGLERMAAVLQGVDTNYHIDILRPLVEAAGEVCGVKYDPDRRQRPPPAAHRRPRPGLHVRHSRERAAGAQQREVRHPPAAAPRGARRPSDGPARAVPVPARAGRRRDDEGRLSRTERNDRARAEGDQGRGDDVLRHGRRRPRRGSTRCSTR